MEMKIVVKEWKARTDEKKQRTVGGKYEIRLGNQVVSTSDFNDGYNTTDISIPADILIDIDELDKKIKKAIIDNFIT